MIEYRKENAIDRVIRYGNPVFITHTAKNNKSTQWEAKEAEYMVKDNYIKLKDFNMIDSEKNTWSAKSGEFSF